MIVGSAVLVRRMVLRRSLSATRSRKVSSFIYLRRHRVEQKGRFTFFDDIAHEFPGYEFAVHGNDAVNANGR